MFLIFFLLPIFLSLYALFPSFYLGLFGDDFLEIWRFFYTTNVEEYGKLGYLSYLFSRYGSFDLIMGLLVSAFGYQSIYFYATAYILRIIAAFSFFPLVYYFTKNKFIPLLAVIFFSVTAIGIDATNWVFNMPVYLGIGFLNLFFLFYIRSRLENNDKLFGISLVFFILTIIIAAVRMTGLFPMIFLIELFLILKLQRNDLVKFGKRVLILLLVFILISLMGDLHNTDNSLVGSASQWSSIWSGGILTALGFFKEGKFDFLSYPLIMMGNMIIPIETASKNYPFFFASSILLLIIGIRLLMFKNVSVVVSTGIFLSISWFILSFIFAWVRDPNVVLPFSHRYFIVSAVGLTIFFSMLLSFRKNFFILFMPFFLILLILNIHSVRGYLSNLVENVHGLKTSEKIWAQIPYIPEIGKSAQPLVFHFEGEDRSILYGAITFGFPYHMGLLYGLDNYHKMPVPMDDWKQVESAVTDGKSFAPYDHPIKPVPIENIYAFRLEGKDRLVNITDEVRLKLLTYVKLNSKIH